MEECAEGNSLVQDVSDTPSYTIGHCIIYAAVTEEKLSVISLQHHMVGLLRFFKPKPKPRFYANTETKLTPTI